MPVLRPELMLLALLASEAVSLAETQQTPPPVQPDAFEEIVVTASRRTLAPLLQPMEYFRDHCFEANRTTGRSAPPAAGSDWEPLGEGLRRRLGITDPAVGAFGLVDPGRGHSLILRIERLPRPREVVESRCTLILIGGTGHHALVDQVSALMRAPGTRRHVGHSDGVPTLAGWQQWLWTAMPGRRSRNWRVRPQGSWLVVLDPDFYNRYDYIMTDLKISQGRARPVSILTFAHISRPRG